MAVDQILEWDLDATLAPYFACFVSFWAVRLFHFFFVLRSFKRLLFYVSIVVSL